MDDLIRLVYASEPTIDYRNTDEAIDALVEEILRESRSHNAQNGIGGVLFYDNGYFFQCLEGPREVIAATFYRIAHDPRHTQAHTLLNSFTKRRLFEGWSMKHLRSDSHFRAFLAQHALTEFTPYDYDREMVGRLLIFLQQAKESEKFAEKIVEKTTEETPPEKPKSGWRRLFSS